MKIIKYLALFIFVISCSHTAFAQLNFKGKVVEVVDGKTVVIELVTKNRLTAELQYIEVPEPQQQLHQVVKDHLQELVLGKVVEFSAKVLAPTKTVGQILTGGVDISQQMIRDGAAWYAVLKKEGQDVGESQNYMAVESQAKAEKRGVWSVENLKPAWEFRAEKEKLNKPQESPVRQPNSAEILAQQEKQSSEKTPKNRSVFGQPRYSPEIVQQQVKGSSDDGMWTDVKSYKDKEEINKVGLASKYVPSGNFGYLATTISKFKLPKDEEAAAAQMMYRIGYFYRGSSLVTGEDAFLISFLSESKNWKFLQSNNLVIVADGKIISLGKARRFSNQDTSSVQELLLYKIPRSALTKIADAKKAEFKIGKYVSPVEKGSQNTIGQLLESSK